MKLYEIAKKLIGPAYPIGCTATDSVRLVNLKAEIELTESLIRDLFCVHHDNKDCVEKSRKDAVNLVEEFFKNNADYFEPTNSKEGE